MGMLILFWLIPRSRIEVEKQNRDLARAIQIQIDSYLVRAIGDVRAISYLDLENFSRRDIQRLLDSQIDISASLDSIYVLRREGRIIAASIGRKHEDAIHSDINDMDLSSNPLFREALKLNKSILSDTFLSIISRKPSVAIAVPNDKSILIGELDLDKLTDFLKHTPAKQGEQIYVIDKRGNVIADKNGSYNAQQLNLKNIPLIKDGLSSTSPIYGRFTLSGNDLYGHVIRIPSIDWLILVAQPAEFVHRDALLTSSILICGLSVALLLTVTTTLFISRRFSKKFELLTNHARLIADGCTEFDSPKSTIQEFEQVAISLQQMSTAINDRERRLREHEKLLRSVMDNTFSLQGLLSPEGVLLDANETSLDFIGCKKEEVIGKHFWDTPWWQHDPKAQQKLRNSVLQAADGAFIRFETSHKNSKGTVNTIDFSIKPIFDEDGKVTFLIPEGRDISERVQLEKELRILHSAIEQSPVNVVITDISGKIEYVNPGFTKLTGYTAAEAIGQNPSILKSGLTDESVFKQLWETITAGEIWDGEICNKKKNGDIYWENACIAPVTDKNNRITHYVAIKEDITEKKWALEEIFRSANRFQILYELSTMSEENEDKILEYAIEACVKITQSEYGVLFLVNADETSLQINRWSKKVPADCSVKTGSFFNSIHADGIFAETISSRNALIVNNYKDSATKTCLPKGHIDLKRLISIPLIDNGKIVIIAAICNKEGMYDDHDIQQLTVLLSAMWRMVSNKQSISMLKESEERFHRMFFQNDNPFLLVHRESLVIADMNPAAASIFGLGLYQPANLNLQNLIPENIILEISKAFTNNDSSSSILINRAEISTSYGDRKLVSIRAQRLQMQNEEMILLSIRDITERARLEEEIKTSRAKLIHANKMTSLGMLVSGVAHEINNPNQCIAVNTSVLSNIWNDTAPILSKYCEIVGTQLIGGLSCSEVQEMAPQLFDGISESSQRISNIISNMRDYVKGGQSRQEGSFDVNQAISNATTILWHNIQKYSDNFQQQLTENIPLASGSPQQVEQVIINLIMNALQSLPDKSCEVIVGTTYDTETEKVIITVRDSGKGMDAKTMERIAEPFFTTRESEGGTGLGLYISQTIIRDYNGSLEFNSEPGKGTTATIKLPAVMQAEE